MGIVVTRDSAAEKLVAFTANPQALQNTVEELYLATGPMRAKVGGGARAHAWVTLHHVISLNNPTHNHRANSNFKQQQKIGKV